MSKPAITNLKKRQRQEARFKAYCLAAILFATCFLVILVGAVLVKGRSAFYTHQIALEVDLSKKNFELAENTIITKELLADLNYRTPIKEALKSRFPDAKNPAEKIALYHLVSKIAALELKKAVLKNPDLIDHKQSFWFSVSSDVDMFLKNKISQNSDENFRKLKDQQIAWIKNLQKNNQIRSNFNWNFFRYADSREPEIAGIAASVSGSFLTMLVFLFCAFPLGVMCAFYLEEFAKKNLLTDIIEININNLAAIPSIIFGLLGLVVFLNFFHLPRSSSIVGGLTLSLMVLPVIIIATRNTIKTIPPSIKEAAIAMGASRVQVMLHHTLPLSLPGIMTGTILAISRAIGETAPLLMIGMVAFIADIPSKFTDPTTVMPVQIYLWSDAPESGFAERTAAAILILLLMLVLFNSIAIYIRKKFEKKW